MALVQEKFAEQARRTLAAIERADPGIAGRTDLVTGDITVPGLGLSDADRSRLLAGPLEIFHLAAVYDLSVPAELGWRVNVDGTRNVVDLARAAMDGSGLTRLQYVSTCYVSGRYDGIFSETDLELGQPFANHYDHTKHEAERVVAKARDAGLPVSVYRPSIVVGDSVTGATQKYDGPYYLLQLLARQGRTAFVPLPRRASRTRFNLVPSDYVVDAIAALAGHDAAVNRTFALAQPDPPTVTRMCEVFADRLGARLRTIPMATGPAAFAIDRVPGVGRFLKVPSSTLEYLTHPSRYDTAATTRMLSELGVHCPAFDDHVDAMVAYFRANPQVGSTAMI
ncbi:hypothetical protein AFB00_07360 [Pseudonocardia sp. HH130630-07]|nr:hypothetical protein AFB00_07360 [Pseudonocardia sp. HH130630-07]